jgi:hypothetical protein
LRRFAGHRAIMCSCPGGGIVDGRCVWEVTCDEEDRL